MAHHQTNEVREALSRHQVIFFVGARGTGKTLLAAHLESEFNRTDVQTIRLEASDAFTPADLNEPIAAVLGCPSNSLTAESLPRDARVRIIIDQCEELHDKPWLPYLQDQWRALLSEPEARGRVALLLLGRPLFRALGGGRGSPLLTIGVVKPARPLDTDSAASTFGVRPNVADPAIRKTGGHPYLTSALLRAIDGDAANFKKALPPFIAESRRYVMRLIEDHALAAHGVLADLLDARSPVAEAALIGKHFGDARLFGEECLEDLCGSGLIERETSMCSLAAELLRAIPDLRLFLRVQEVEVETEPTEHHGLAAATLFCVENLLRRRIGLWLEEIDQAWWPGRVPESLVAAAELRRRSELESSVCPEVEPHPILYLTVGEMCDLVMSQENWDQVFRVRFGMTRSAFEETKKDLLAVRNKVAHNRVVSASDVAILEGAVRRLGLSS